MVLDPAAAGAGMYVRGEATRKGRRANNALPGTIERAGEVKTKSGRIIQAFAVQCPICSRWRSVRRKDHAIAHVGKPCKKCSSRRPKEIYRGFRMSWFRKYEYHAGMRNKAWELSVDEAVDIFENQNGCCALTGLPLATNGPFNDITASLDRIDNSRGYTPDNVHWVHKAVNFMRGDMPLDEFVHACRGVAKHTCNWSW